MKKYSGKILLAAAALAMVHCGCSRNEEESRAAKEPAAMKPAAAHATASGGTALKWTAPPEWTSETPTSSMRQAQYRLPRLEGDPEDAELVVFYFQGGGGGVQANIDRWIGMFNKADGSPATDAARTSKKVANGIPVTIVDVSGTYMAGAGSMMGGEPKPKPNFRMLGAVAEHSSGPWFFRLTGPTRTVGKWEAGFQKFLDTLQ